jgi:iron(III)-salmochelin esterase
VETTPDAAPPTSPARGQIAMTTWSFDGGGKAAVLVPAWTQAKLPLLFALHGRGEALKGPTEGVMGWPRDYALVRAIQRVCNPPLATDDFEGFVEADRLKMHNDALGSRPFAGLVVVCPYSPDVELRKPEKVKEYADYVTRVILPRARKELPVLTSPASTGIDGVSLGGALSLRIGLGNPELFGAIGTLQPAIGEDQVSELTDLARAGRAKNPKVALRLLTSKDDYFRNAIKATSQSFKEASIKHDFENIPGPHDYPFNRGPGAIEMLLWHDRVLARA